MDYKKIDSELVSRIKAKNIVSFISNYLKLCGETTLVEMLIRFNLWGKDTIRILDFLRQNKIIIVNNSKIRLSSSINKNINSNILEKYYYLVDWSDITKVNSNINTTLINHFKLLTKNRPQVDTKLDQYYCTPETNNKRLNLVTDAYNLSQKICFLGDDDLTSIFFALTKKHSITVYEIDKRLVKFIKNINKKSQLNININEHDYSKEVSLKKFDIIFSDPCATLEAAELVLLRAKKIAHSKTNFILSWAEFVWDPTYYSKIKNIFEKTGWVLRKKYLNFNEYENECLLKYLTKNDWAAIKRLGSSRQLILNSPPIQKYGVYVLENGSETNIQWNKKKNIYLDDNQIKKIKGMKI
ncbi:MAG: bis-aminopropyl spermidine synthase family protein [archaeon]|jgi:predicted methyltransferase